MSGTNPSHDDTLLTRVRIHCQQTARDTVSSLAEAIIKGENYTGWFILKRNSFITLKTQRDEQEPSLAFLPATEQQIQETEQQLGFPLSRMLRLLYMQVANGGFGPGYGIIGAVGGFPALDDPYGDLVQTYPA